jgi:hypothetical protein
METNENKFLLNSFSYPFQLVNGKAKLNAKLQGVHADTVKLIYEGAEYTLSNRIEKLRVWELLKPLRVWIYEYHSHKRNIFTYSILAIGGHS